MRDSTAALHRVARCAVATAIALSTLLPAAAQEGLPAGYELISGRDSATAIVDPDFVPAAAARLRDDAWVIGVQINGRARAYGLELLNAYEVVNDELGGTAVAVVWSPFANAAVVVRRPANGETLVFDADGGLVHGGQVLRDRQTGSYWPLLRGAAETGPLAGMRLEVLPVSDRMLWAEWLARHPDTEVLSITRGDGEVSLQDPGTDQHADFFAAEGGYGGARADRAPLDDRALVFAFWHQGAPYAVDARRVIGGQTYTLADGTALLVYREASDRLFRGSAAFVSRAGFEQRGGSWFELATDAEFNAITRDFGGAGIERLAGFDVFWYAWVLSNPSTQLLRQP